MRRSRRLVVGIIAGVVLLALVIGIVALSSGDEDAGADEISAQDFEVPEGTEPLGAIRAGSVAQLASCEDWNEGSVVRRKATVVDLREQLSSGGVPEGRALISDPEAYETFQRACANEFAEAFLLYKIYFRAAAFNNFDPQEVVDQATEE